MAGGTAFHALGEARRMGKSARTGSGTTGSGARNNFSMALNIRAYHKAAGAQKKRRRFTKSETIVKLMAAFAAAMAGKSA